MQSNGGITTINDVKTNPITMVESGPASGVFGAIALGKVIGKNDLIVLDIMLPNVDGYTLGKELKKRNPDIPIIFLSAKNQPSDVNKGFKKEVVITSGSHLA